MVGFALKPIEDKTDYPFRNDADVIGKWQAVDLVIDIDQFKPGQKSWQNELFLTDLVFSKEGKMLLANTNSNGNLGLTNFTWTKGIIINKQEKTASKYEIKMIDGCKYIFFEWKNGDYTYSHWKPSFYVLKQIDKLDYSNY